MPARSATPAIPAATLRTGTRSQLQMRTVNSDVRKVLRAGATDRIPFFCECPDFGCYHPLWLTLADFDLLAAGDTFGIAPGHVFESAPDVLIG